MTHSSVFPNTERKFVCAEQFKPRHPNHFYPGRVPLRLSDMHLRIYEGENETEYSVDLLISDTTKFCGQIVNCEDIQPFAEAIFHGIEIGYILAEQQLNSAIHI